MAIRKTQGKQPQKEIKKAEIKLADMVPAELIGQAKELREKIAAANMERIAGKAKNLKMAYNLKKQLAITLIVLKSKSV